MTRAEMIETVRVLSDEYQLTDGVVAVYLNLAGQKIINKAYPYAKEDDIAVPAKYQMLQCQISAYMINRRGSEGESKNIEVGTQRDYPSADVPDDMLSSIVPMVGLPRR